MPEGESERPHVEDLEQLSGSAFEILVKKIYNDPSLIETVAPSQHRRLIEVIIQDGGSYFVASHPDAFTGLTSNEIVHILIERGGDEYVTANLEKFSGLDVDIARRLIEMGDGEAVSTYLEYFSGLDADIARALTIQGFGTEVAMHTESFTGLTVDVAKSIISFESHDPARASIAVIEHCKSFVGLDDAKLAELLFDNQKSGLIAYHRELFPSVSTNELVRALARDYFKPDEFERYLQRVQVSDIDAYTIDAVISHNFGEIILKKADELKNLEPWHARSLVAKGCVKSVMERIDSFHLERANEKDRFVLEFLKDETVPKKIRESEEVEVYLSMHIRANSHETILEKETGRWKKPDHLPTEEEAVYELDPDALRARVQVGIPPEVYARVKYFGQQPERAMPDVLLDQWAKNFAEQTGDQDILDALAAGRKTFGDRVMLDYMRMVDVSMHDATHFMTDIVVLQKKSGLSPEEFGKNILAQVGRDGANYAEGSAHHRFAAVCNELANTSIATVLKEAEKYGNVKKMQDLVEDIGKENFASSWKTLKKTYELVQLLGRTEILDELNSAGLDPKMRAYVEKLAFHPNISTEAVITFWKDPARFLDIDDDHTQERINEVKKPSNYLSLPFLGLEAEDLRDAYVFGELDALQTLPPMEQMYVLGVSEAEDLTRPETVHAFLRRALGQERKGIKGEGKNPKKIFDELRSFCSEQKCYLPDLLDPEKGRAIVQQLPQEAVDRLREIAFDKNIGMQQPNPKTETYRIRIGVKSDPEMAVAGNDTTSCMPFGSGKNNVYMFNPNCTQLVLERQQEDGSWRTAAQSVMTIDHVTSKSTSGLIEQYTQKGRLSELISEDDLLRTPVVTCDNIQISKNEEGRRTRFIREAYERYFKDYLAAYASVLGVDATRVVVGTGYTPENIGLPSVDNTFVPQAPMGYSDNVHKTAYLIETGLKPLEAKLRQGMAPLSTRDALAVAMLEGKAYKDNESLLMNLHHMQNAIIGMEIVNAHFKRPNLSSMYRDVKGLPRGYMLAYEGVNGGLPEVYIDDLASDRTNRMAGGRLINQFFESYLRNYGTEQRPFLPIFTNARESTSYPILKANVERLAERAGLVAEMVELGTHERGQDAFHDVRIHIGRTPEELEAQKAKYADTAAAADASDEDW